MDSGNGKKAFQWTKLQTVIGIIVSILMILNLIVLIPLKNEASDLRSEMKELKSEVQSVKVDVETSKIRQEQINENKKRLEKLEDKIYSK